MSEQSEITDKFYSERIVHLPPMTWAFAEFENCRDIFKKFIDDVDLFNIKPDARVFGFNAFGKEKNANAFFASIPDDLEVPEPFLKIDFHGGLYMMIIGKCDMGRWSENNADKYENDNRGLNKPIFEEFINPFNRYGLNDYYEQLVYETDIYLPIKEKR